jgi:hypothetical protein
MGQNNKHALWVGLELKRLIDEYTHEKEFKSAELALLSLLEQSNEFKKFKEFLDKKPKFKH